MRIARHCLYAGAAFALLAWSVSSGLAQDYTAAKVHAIAMFGQPEYPAGFSHFSYVNPNAPKGGSMTLESTSAFDSFNPYILRGRPAPGLTIVGSDLVNESLLETGDDEPFTKYGRLAETVELPQDRSWIAFNLNPDARFHDGSPVTAEDVIWSFNTLVEKGSPLYASYWGDVREVRATGERRVLFIFKTDQNKELPLILGQIPVLSKAFWQGRDFAAPLTEPPVGSGPYRVESFEFGRRIVYRRDANYWGADIPVNKGRYNIDRVAYEVFRDKEVATEAFKAGAFDIRQENSAKRWATAFDFPALRDGFVVKEELLNNAVGGLQGFVFNTRKPIFRDRRVREALSYAFDFEWTNRTLMYDAYARTNSFFTNTALASSGLPGAAELALLEPLRDRLPPEVFTDEYKAPVTDGSGNNRRNLRTGLKLLQSAGWELRDGVMTRDGLKLEFEILLTQAGTERLVLPFVENLAKLGVRAQPRRVDPAQYQNRMRDFDFDMTIDSFGQSNSPGNEQMEYWGSALAERPGSRNTPGIKDPAIDALIGHVVAADSRADQEAAVRALDRALLWGHYVIPQFHSTAFRFVYWNKFDHPERASKFGLDVPGTWWVDAEKAEAVRAYQGRR